MFEQCQLKAKTVVNPIIDWKTSDIWEYINSEKICTNCLYKKGYDRVATKYNGYVIAISKGNISVYKNRILVYNIPIRDYMKNPVSCFYAITKICKGAD